MKAITITQEGKEYRVVLHNDEKTPSEIPIYQTFIEKGLNEVFERIRGFYGEDNGKKKEVR